MSDNRWRLYLCPDTSKFATGSALYQIQNGPLRLIMYASKRMPTAAHSCSINELEFCRFAMNIVRVFSSVEESQFRGCSRPFSTNTYYEGQVRTSN